MSAQNQAEIIHKSLPFQLKALADEEGTIEGYGAVFGNVDGVNDILLPGSFAKAIRGNQNVKMLWQHDFTMPIGTWNNLTEDSNGLKVSGKIATKTQLGNDAYQLVKAGAIDSLSIGFIPTEWEIDSKKGIRTIKSVQLYEVSLVTFSANSKAKIVNVKSLPEDIRSFERFLSDAGYSRSEAKRIASTGFNKKDQREVGAITPVLKSLEDKIDMFNSTLRR